MNLTKLPSLYRKAALAAMLMSFAICAAQSPLSPDVQSDVQSLQTAASLAWDLYKQHQYSQAAALLERVAQVPGVESLPEWPRQLYNLACDQALAGETSVALQTLTKAVERGGVTYSHLRTDSDLSSLQATERFQQLEAQLAREETLWGKDPANAASVPPFQFLQKAGPYSVGLRVVDQYDPSRKSLVVAADHPNRLESDKGRPLQTLIWYPALPSGIKPMTVGDYVALADTEISFGAPDQAHNKWRRRLQSAFSSFDVPLWAARDAKMADGHYPVLIYAPSDSSVAWENADLCEYLASHGYVVLASRSMGVSTRDMTDDLAGIDSQSLDISFLATYAEKLPYADSSKIAVVSFSWGGISSLFAAVRDSRIHVLVEMDGSMRYYPGLVAEAGNIHPEQLNVPLLFFTSNNANFIEDAESWDATPADTIGRNVLNEWTHADVMTVNMLGMSHPEFCSMFERLKTPKDFATWDRIADYERDEANTSYSWVTLYTLQFLNAYVRDDTEAKAFLRRNPAANGVPKHLMGIKFRPAQVLATTTVR
jgi:dienelactone hydrolase